MRMLQMGSRGADVRRVQTRLNERGGYGLTEDGVFGSMTRSAVVKFQRANGLADDGVVGPKTFAALGLTEGSATGQPAPAASGRRRRSLHIGVNRVDPAHYDGWDGALGGCENDAQTMRAIAVHEGFAVTALLTQDASATNVLAEIAAAADQLVGGDVFLLTYAGHGAQVPNVSGDTEIDQQDETWVLFERMLIDDELERAFSAFSSGVDIVLLSDSCHSGTVYRKMFSPGQLEYADRKSAFYRDLRAEAVNGSRSYPTPVAAGGSRAGLPGPADPQPGQRFAAAAASFREKLAVGAGWGSQEGPYVSIFDRFEKPRSRAAGPPLQPRRHPRREDGGGQADRGAPEPVATRNMPLDVNAAVVAHHAALYSRLQRAARGEGTIRANGLSISGCLDSQLSQEVGGHGVYTTALEQAWNSGSFTGDYRQFHQAIVGRMGPNQTPELGLWGAAPATLAAKTPFS